VIFISLKCQPFILLDRKVHQKVTVTDTVTRQHLNAGYFPVYKSEFDSMILMIDKFRNLKDDGLERRFYNTADFKTSHITFQIESIRRVYWDSYDINMVSSGPFGQTVLKISDQKFSLNENERGIRGLLSYLKSRKKEIDKGEFILAKNAQ
jgi:hypothetical protein